MHQTLARQTLITLASAVPASVQTAGAEILSCADVDYPIANPNATFATCTVASNKTFNAVGIVSLDTNVDGLDGLSWVKAVGAEEVIERERVYDQTFYLGTPDDFDLDDTGACAFFFTEVSDRVRFGDGDARNTRGTSGQALSDSCVSALTNRAEKVDLNGLSGREACEKLQRNFLDNLASDCSAFAPGERWTDIKAKGECILVPARVQERPEDSDCCFFDSPLRQRISRTHLQAAEQNFKLLANTAQGRRLDSGRVG
ncbi:hypothetical protein VTG60DRAFT_6126 [Thermothelomyces hinnuleus]